MSRYGRPRKPAGNFPVNLKEFHVRNTHRYHR